MAVKITKKITGYEVVKDDDRKAGVEGQQSPAKPQVLDRPLELNGTTYRFKPGAPYKDDWVYVTINDIIDGDGLARPFEVFIVQRDPRNFEYVNAIARMISAILRRQDDVRFVPDELKQIFSSTGFFPSAHSGLPVGQYMPSIVAAIGHVLERHWKRLGLLPDADEDGSPEVVSIEEAQRQSVGAARVRMDDKHWCSNCNCAKVEQGGCATCPQCGSSTCG